MRFVPPEGTELREILGNGSVFQVAVVLDAGAPRVCKRLTPRVRGEHAGRAAIVREAKLLSRARHPALPAFHRVGTDAHGPFLIEERIEGTSLRALVEGWRSRGDRVPPSLVRHLAPAAALSLAALHELADASGPIGLVHGDLGPDHVIMSPLGEVRFIDLGASRFAGMEASLETSDRGTLPFVAPEIARGDAPPDAAGDVYALAATILFLATGGPLADARDEAAMLLEIGERGLCLDALDDADGVAGLSDRGRAAIRRALAHDPARRLASARDLAAALA